MKSKNPRNWDISNLYNNLVFSNKEIINLLTKLDSLKGFDLPAGDFSLNFVGAAKISELHDKFMNDPTPTDVITFKGDPDMDFAGEVCISVDRALESYKEYNHTFQEELTLYIVHGWLHLVGYDDIEDEDRLKMREAETLVMNEIKEFGCLPNFSIRESS